MIEYLALPEQKSVCRLTNDCQWNDSIWFFGCSHVYGWGVSVEESTPFQLEKILNFPVLNFGIPRGSPMLIKYNLDILLTHYKPRAIIIAWPSLERWLSWKDNKPLQWTAMHFWENINRKEIDRAPEDFERYKSLVLNNEIKDINFNLIKDIKKELGDLLIDFSYLKDIRLQSISVTCFDKDKKSTNELNWIDICSDTWHPGPETHNKIATWLSNEQKLSKHL